MCTAGGTVCPCVQSQLTFFVFLRNVLTALRDGGTQAQHPAMLIFLNENLVFKNNCQILKIRSLLYLYYFKLLYNLMTFVLQTPCILTL